MGFWPFKRKQKAQMKPLELSSSEGTPPAYLQKGLDEAKDHPLDDMVWRLVVASPERHVVTEFGLLTMSTACDAHEKSGLKQATEASAQVLSAILEKGIPLQGEALELFRFVAFAFFDAEFTRGANKGKTHATAWNTLTLEVETADDRIRIVRRAIRIEYPDGVPDLSFPGGLFNPLR